MLGARSRARFAFARMARYTEVSQAARGILRYPELMVNTEVFHHKILTTLVTVRAVIKRGGLSPVASLRSG